MVLYKMKGKPLFYNRRGQQKPYRDKKMWVVEREVVEGEQGSHKVTFVFTGGASIDVGLSMEAIDRVRNYLTDGEPVAIQDETTTLVVFPQNLCLLSFN